MKNKYASLLMTGALAFTVSAFAQSGQGSAASVCRILKSHRQIVPSKLL